MAQDAGASSAEAAQGFDAWNPGIESRIPPELRHLSTIHHPEHAFTTAAEAAELTDLTGLPVRDLVALQPRRLALHEVLIRVTANLSVPDGSRIEDLGINFRRMTQTLLTAAIDPAMAAIETAYAAVRAELEASIDRALDAIPELHTTTTHEPSVAKRGWRRWLASRAPQSAPAARPAAHATRTRDPRDPLLDGTQEAAERAVTRVVSALTVRHGRVWGERATIARVALNLACNDAGSEAIGELIEPWLNEAATREGYGLLPRQAAPVVMNTKGASASGKSTLRPLQRRLAGEIGVAWSEFALISPDIWRKQLIDYEALGPVYKYGAMFTGDELYIVDQKLDRYMARKADRGDMPHLLIDRFRFDSFAPDSDEAGSNLLTRFGHIVYLFFMITPPASLVERAWKRGLDVGRYKAVDDTLAHGVEAYAGMPGLFFTWVRRTDKRVHFEFLDNTVALGETPRTVAFGRNDTMNVLDVGCILDVERFRHVDVDATDPSALYPDPRELAAARNTGFLRQCVENFAVVHFADQDTGRIYLRIEAGRVAWVDDDALTRAFADGGTREGLAAVVPGLATSASPGPPAPVYLGDLPGFERQHTLGRWGSHG